MSQNTKTPTEITCEFVRKCAQAYGIELVQEHKSWEKFIAPNGHKLCVKITKGETPLVDTTVDITDLPNVMLRGRDVDANGRFVSLFPASAALIEAAVKLMAESDGIRPVRRTKKAPVAFRLEGLGDEHGPVQQAE